MLSAVYWDASAILSTLFSDPHSADALTWLRRDCAHLVSTLAYAEACSVLSRLRREGAISDGDLDEAMDSLSCAPWRRITLNPGWDEMSQVARRSSLRGADLWHIASFLALKRRGCPDLWMLTYDEKLRAAASDVPLVVRAPEEWTTQ